MKLSALLEGITIVEQSADMDMEIRGVSYDSRKTQQGDLFVAVRGFASDGHRYIDTAVQQGAVCVLCEEKPTCDVPYVLIANTRRGLAITAANYFDNPAKRMKIIGITGTNGKTTTTTLVKEIIERISGAKVGLIGTNDNRIGQQVLHTERTTPESYELQKLFSEMATAGCEYVVMEVSSHALCLDRVYGVPFAVGLFTNLTQDHLDFHKTMQAYGEAKALLFRQCEMGIVNLDDTAADIMMQNAACPMYTYSVEKNEADLVAKDVTLKANEVHFCALTIGKLVKVKLGIPGMFSVYNALATIAIGIQLGYAVEDVVAALRECKGVKGRAEVVPTNRDFTILIDYAHTPDAMENILKTVRSFASGRVVVLFGCGGDRDKTKRPIMGKISTELADFVIVTSDNPRTEAPGAILDDILVGMQDSKTPYTVIENRKEAIGWAIRHAQPDDVIVLAGKGHETYQVLGTEKFHFDEREIVAEFLAE